MMLTDFSTPYLNYRPRTPPLVWPFIRGKFMLPLVGWGVGFHLWYMHASKLGMKDFVVWAPKEYFHFEEDCYFADFHDMHRLLWCKDLNIAQVTLFAL